MFEKAQAILSKRGTNRRGVEKGKREKYSRKYAFSSELECVFCGSNLSRRSRRNWHSGTIHEKVIWQCVTATKKGKKYCVHSKAIEEKIIEDAFVESYKLLCNNNSDVLDELVRRMEAVLSGNDFQKRLTKVENEIQAIEQKRNRLIDMRLEELIDKATYKKKYTELNSTLEGLAKEKDQLEKSSKEEIDLEKRIEHFRKVLEKNEVLTAFDSCVFESIVDKVIVGEIDEYGSDLMAMHEFGIFETDPESKASYDTYEPEKYNCIAVDDNYIEQLLGKLSTLDIYFHSVSRPDKGLAYTGITLIPPSSLPKFKKVIDSTGVSELQILSKKKVKIEYPYVSDTANNRMKHLSDTERVEFKYPE